MISTGKIHIYNFMAFSKSKGVSLVGHKNSILTKLFIIKLFVHITKHVFVSLKHPLIM